MNAAHRQETLKKITRWAQEHPGIRSALLTSSLVNPQAPVDDFSDLDIELVLADLPAFLNDDRWLEQFGRPIALVAEPETAFEGKHAMRMVLYHDYVKVDFKLYCIEKFTEEVNQETLCADWDIGYRVLVDKDGLTTNMKSPTYTCAVIRKPGEQEFTRVLNDFWWDLTYVAKCLKRGDLFYARFMTEDNIRTQYLIPLLEWFIASDHHWTVTTNKKGRLFEKYLSKEMWQKITATFAGR